MKWTQQEAIDICRTAENYAPAFGFHVALTGGLLYKTGARDDLDLMFYRVRQVADPDYEGLLDQLCKLGFDIAKFKESFVTKASFHGRKVDIMFPDLTGEYPEDPEQDCDQKEKCE